MGSPPRRDPQSRFAEALDHELQGLEGWHVAALRRLLRIPTPRMREHRAVRFVARALGRAGCQVEVFEGEGAGEATPNGRPINLFARRPGLGGGRSLLLEAHMDAVPPGDEQRWTAGPWSGAIDGGRIYARGAHDDRAGAAILWMVADLLKRLQVQTRGDLYLLVTTEEEFSSGGMRAYLRRPDRVRPDAHLLVDGNREPHLCILGHPGVLSFQIRIQGPYESVLRDSVHQANPIELMAALVQALRRFEEAVRQRLSDMHIDPRWPPPIVAVTEIGSQGWLSNTPEECSISGFCNAPPPLTLDQYKASFEAFIQDHAQGTAWLIAHPPAVTWGPLEVPAMVTSESSQLFRTLEQAHRRSFGTALAPRYIGGWGDMRLLGCDSAVFYGPGGGGGDHSYDEYYVLKDLAPMLRTLVDLVVSWCGRL